VVPEPASSVPPWEDLPPEAQLGEFSGHEPAAARTRPGAPATSMPPPAAASLARPARQAVAVALDTPTAQAEPTVQAEPTAQDTPTAGQVEPAAQAEPACVDDEAAHAWHATLQALGLGGMVRELAQHCEWVGREGDALTLRLSATHRHLLEMNRTLADRLQDALAAHYGCPLRLAIQVGAIAGATPAQRDQAARRARHVEAVAALERDPFVRELIERFDATLVEASVQAL
jgi:DNA polymerase-3 subunit gamma/tau